MRKPWLMPVAILFVICTTLSTEPQNQKTPNAQSEKEATTSAQQQTESRTEDQCRADANAWQSEYLSSGDNAVAMPVLDKRAIEITNCGSEYGGDTNFDYSVVLAGLWDTEERRERAYITEHNLLNKFLAEDAAKAKGK